PIPSEEIEQANQEVEEEIKDAFNEDPVPPSETMADAHQPENPVDGKSAINESAFGTSSGSVQSDSSLTPIPGNVQPEYPMWSRLRRQEGTVQITFDLLADGSVANSRIAQSSGFEYLDNA